MAQSIENPHHRQGIAPEPKYRCPNCNNGLNISKPVFMVVCAKCKKIIKQEEL